MQSPPVCLCCVSISAQNFMGFFSPWDTHLPHHTHWKVLSLCIQDICAVATKIFVWIHHYYIHSFTQNSFVSREHFPMSKVGGKATGHDTKGKLQILAPCFASCTPANISHKMQSIIPTLWASQKVLQRFCLQGFV